jgi:hypothetical protein
MEVGEGTWQHPIFSEAGAWRLAMMVCASESVSGHVGIGRGPRAEFVGGCGGCQRWAASTVLLLCFLFDEVSRGRWWRDACRSSQLWCAPVVLVVMLGVVASVVHSGEGGGLLVCVVGSDDDGVRLWSCYRHRRWLRGF